MAKQTRERSYSSLFWLRSFLIFINLVTLLVGVVTVTVGIWLYFQDPNVEAKGDTVSMESSEDSIILPEFKQFSYILIGLGSIVAFVSFIGCFGAVIKSSCLLLCYLTVVVLILTLQLMVSVFAIIYRQPMSDMFREELRTSMKKKYIDNQYLALTWDDVQSQFRCCGMDGYSDWFKSDSWPDHEYVPDSCCHPHVNITDCGKTVNPTLWHNQGCLGQIQLWILEQVHILALIIIGLVFLQLYGIIASILLFYNSKPPKNPKAYQSYPYERART